MKFSIFLTLASFTALVLYFTSCSYNEDVIIINEVCGNDNTNDEWVELYNPTSHTIFLDGWKLIKIDEDGIDSNLHKFKHDSIEPHSFYLLSRKAKKLQGKISAKKEVGIELIGLNDKTIDRFYRDDEIGETPHPFGGSYSRCPDGSNIWNIVCTATPGEKNADDIVANDEIEAEFNAETEE